MADLHFDQAGVLLLDEILSRLFAFHLCIGSARR